MRGSLLVVSAIVHVAVVAVVLHAVVRDAPAAQAGTIRRAPEVPPTIATAPIEVTILPDARPIAPPPPAIAPGRRASSVVATAGTATGAATEAATATTSDVATRGGDNPYMHMRGGDLPDVGTTLDHIAAEGSAAPPPDVPTGMLHERGGDRATIYDTVTAVEVEADGTAHFHDRPSAGLHGPNISRRGLGDLLTEWYADPYAGTRVGTTQDLPEHLRAVPGQCDDWGSCTPTGGGPGVGRGAGPEAVLGGGDITDWLMRRHHMDPYASRKLKLLDATREERFARGRAYRAEQLQRSAEYMQRNLAALYAATAPPADKRELLFELWDECAEGDDALGQAGARARSHVIGWIGAHIPKGAPDAFTDDELAAMNARRSSKQAFAPY